MRSLLLVLLSCATLSQARCPTDVLVMYHMVLHTEWSVEKFPKQYPEWRPPAQWSVVVGRSHNSSGMLWRLGQTSSDSVKQFVETSKAEMLIREGAEQKRGILSEFFAPPVGQGVGSTGTKFFADASHSKVSMICRIVPSPDWFIGVDSFDLCRGDKWTDSVTIDLDPVDGGTENGYTFTSPKWSTEPRTPITLITSRFPDHPANSFFYPELEKLPRIAYVKFLKLKQFFLTKQVFQDTQKERGTSSVYATGDVSTISTSPMDELKMHPMKPQNSGKVKREKKKKVVQPAIDALRSKAEATNTKSVQKRNRPRPCRVSEWSDWGPCSKTCGFGEQLRNRKVTHFLLRGGRPCPPLEESRWCRHPESCRNGTIGFFRWQ